MAQGIEQAQKQRELSKEALAADLQRFEARVRSELDVKARIRRDGVRILVVAGAAALLVGGIVLLRLRFGGHEAEATAEPSTIEDLTAELRDLRKAIEKQKKGGSLVQKALLRGVSAAASAGGAYVAKQVLTRQPGAGRGAGTAGAG